MVAGGESGIQITNVVRAKPNQPAGTWLPESIPDHIRDQRQTKPAAAYQTKPTASTEWPERSSDLDHMKYKLEPISCTNSDLAL